jgi:hypothetical protein
LPTAGEENHGTIEACIEALVAETTRLRKAIADSPKPSDASSIIVPPAVDGKTPFAGS